MKPVTVLLNIKQPKIFLHRCVANPLEVYKSKHLFYKIVITEPVTFLRITRPEIQQKDSKW